MTIESATYIDDLNDGYPAGTDAKSEGDNHLRLLKTVLKATFPTDGVYPAFPSGTLMVFQQTAAPTGWTKQTTHNDKALRVVSGTASSGGTSAFTTVFGKTATDAHTLTTSQIPAHGHTFSGTSQGQSADHTHQEFALSLVGLQLGGTAIYGVGVSGTTGYASNDHTHDYSGTTANAGTGGSHTHNIDIRVQYVDLIIAAKD